MKKDKEDIKEITPVEKQKRYSLLHFDTFERIVRAEHELLLATNALSREILKTRNRLRRKKPVEMLHTSMDEAHRRWQHAARAHREAIYALRNLDALAEAMGLSVEK
jgi:predicted P-loop ATPase/GTPase